ncbi:hypothetical protein K443DRAFT_617100 [Laccaria amethystina LaAM-08-1]|uniref:Uncharacterized protein n=1 Tax=Laccaria amethystina LaAM-08-1 TaxID=1095629 RepID=A0A0C9WPV1_9AGAR|nr:hypothetical protein K443DRAFT_617100 [Laccaria amethystina LaAM-08-1]
MECPSIWVHEVEYRDGVAFEVYWVNNRWSPKVGPLEWGSFPCCLVDHSLLRTVKGESWERITEMGGGKITFQAQDVDKENADGAVRSDIISLALISCPP